MPLNINVLTCVESIEINAYKQVLDVVKGFPVAYENGFCKLY
ncbi:MAG: hypothetical protein N2327_06100 [Caldimicrobium sp.]|nr:hypothetical protein [Caldimicrobium sp.]MCX7873984.1 hypothetical protein [Caldimicrobium sp.]MDW8094132.1 hypothetical protein [Caldimicrobium sp.]